MSDWKKELETDAGRYVWLREQCANGKLVIAAVYGWDLESWSGDNIDATIDEAMMPTIPEVGE